MDSLVVECLRCGTSRIVRRDVFKHLDSPECHACGYLGWAPVPEPSALDRRRPRKRPRGADLELPSVA
jgi:hypothetical protein